VQQSVLSFQQSQDLVQQGILLGQQMATQQMAQYIQPQQQQFSAPSQQWGGAPTPAQPPTNPFTAAFGNMADMSDPYSFFQQGMSQKPMQAASAPPSNPYASFGGFDTGALAQQAWPSSLAPQQSQQSQQSQQTGGNGWRDGKVVVPEGCSVFVYHCPPYWNENDLSERFQHFGNVLSTTIIRDKMTGQPKGYG